MIKLRDNAPGYDDSKNRKAVFYTGDGNADNFGNLIKNLTINTGKGNPQAVGVRYNSNNWGTLGDVKIVSGDGSGHAGVDLEYTDQIGPCLIENVEVEGFDYGGSSATVSTPAPGKTSLFATRASPVCACVKTSSAWKTFPSWARRSRFPIRAAG